MDDAAFGVVGSAKRGVKGEVTAGDNGGTGDNGDVARGPPKWPPGGVSDIRCLFLNRAMKPLRPGPADAGGLGIETLNLPASVALDNFGAPGGSNITGS